MGGSSTMRPRWVPEMIFASSSRPLERSHNARRRVPSPRSPRHMSRNTGNSRTGSSTTSPLLQQLRPRTSSHRPGMATLSASKSSAEQWAQVRLPSTPKLADISWQSSRVAPPSPVNEERGVAASEIVSILASPIYQGLTSPPLTSGICSTRGRTSCLPAALNSLLNTSFIAGRFSGRG